MLEEKKINKSSKAEAAKRLRRLRGMTGLNRLEFCEKNNLNASTFSGWENAKFGGLSRKGAEQVISCLKNFGISCTKEWLLHEIGEEPTISVSLEKATIEKNLLETEEIETSTEQKKINSELLLFRKSYKNTIEFIIPDDAMLPLYQKGDHVAGVQLFKKDIAKAINLACIIRLANGEVISRKIHSQNKDKYNLISFNTNISKPYLESQDVVSAAPVIWHRRPFCIH